MGCGMWDVGCGMLDMVFSIWNLVFGTWVLELELFRTMLQKSESMVQRSASSKKITPTMLANSCFYPDIANIIKKSCKILMYMRFRINIFVILRSILTDKKHNC